MNRQNPFDLPQGSPGSKRKQKQCSAAPSAKKVKPQKISREKTSKKIQKIVESISSPESTSSED
jgi:hypothetical protein